MDIDNFTPHALLLWTFVPRDAKTSILKNVFCTKCRTSVEIVDYKGTEKNGDVVLTGRCKVCGNKVVRVVEPLKEFQIIDCVIWLNP